MYIFWHSIVPVLVVVIVNQAFRPVITLFAKFTK